MKNVKNRWLISLFFVFFATYLILSGCRADLTKESPAEILLYWDFDTDEWRGSFVKFKIKEGDRFYRFLEEFSEENKSGWRPCINYVPYILMRSENDKYSINICPNVVQISYGYKILEKCRFAYRKDASSDFFNKALQIIREDYYDQMFK